MYLVKCLSHLLVSFCIFLSATASIAQDETESKKLKQLEYWGARFEKAIASHEREHYERGITVSRMGRLGALARPYLPQIIDLALNYDRSTWVTENSAKAIGKIHDPEQDAWILEDTMAALSEMNLETRDEEEIEKIRRHLYLLGFLEGTEEYLFNLFSNDMQFDEQGNGTYVQDKIVYQITWRAGIALGQKPEFVRANLKRLFEIAKHNKLSPIRERALILIKNSGGDFKPFENDIVYIITHDSWDFCRDFAIMIVKKDEELKSKVAERLLHISLSSKHYFQRMYAQNSLKSIGGLSSEQSQELVASLQSAENEKDFTNALQTIISAGAVSEALGILRNYSSDAQKFSWIISKLNEIVRAEPKAVDLVVGALTTVQYDEVQERQILEAIKDAKASTPDIYYLLTHTRKLRKTPFHESNDDLANTIAEEVAANWKANHSRSDTFPNRVDIAGLWPINIGERQVAWPLTEKSPQYGIYIHEAGYVFWVDLFRVDAEIKELNPDLYIGKISRDVNNDYNWIFPIPHQAEQPQIKLSKKDDHLVITYSTSGAGRYDGLWSSTFGPDLFVIDGKKIIFFEQENPLQLLVGYWNSQFEQDFLRFNGGTVEICDNGRPNLGETYNIQGLNFVSRRTSCDKSFSRVYQKQNTVELAQLTTQELERQQASLRRVLKGDWKFDKFVVHYQYVDVDNQPYRVRSAQRSEVRDLNMLEGLFVGKYEKKVPKTITFSTNGHDLITLDGVTVPVHLNGAFQTIFLDSEEKDPKYQKSVAQMNEKYTELLKRKKPLKLKFINRDRIQISLGDVHVVDGEIDEYRIEIVRAK